MSAGHLQRAETLRAEAALLRAKAEYADPRYFDVLRRAQNLDREADKLLRVAKEPEIERRRELARIHILADELGYSEAGYRDMVFTQTRMTSAGDCDAFDRGRVIKHLEAQKRAAGTFISPRITLPEDRAAMGRKVCAMLVARRAGHAYADAIAQRLDAVERWEFLPADGLHKLVAALEFDKRRHPERGR